MPSHMSTLGFLVQAREDFVGLARQTVGVGSRIEVSGPGSYQVWSPGEGIELWAQLDQRGEVIGLNPHFSGETRMRAGLIRRISRPRDSALDGAFYASANPPEDNPAHGAYPFVFDTPDYRAYDALQLPEIIPVQLAAFAHSLKAFDDEQAMRASDGGGIGSMAAESCIPSGTFTPDGKTIDPPKAEVIFCGRVLETSRLTNPFTRRSFYWARMRTLGGEVDVVADPEIIKGTIVRDGIVGGTFWLSGRLK